MFQAIVSVIAVNTQFNSPNIVRRSFNVPGILKETKYYRLIITYTIFNNNNFECKSHLSTSSRNNFEQCFDIFCITNLENYLVLNLTNCI